MNDRSSSVAVHPIMGCFVKGEEEIGEFRIWDTINYPQSEFVTDILPHRSDLHSFTDEEFESMLSFDAAELNRFLASKGFDIQLQPFAANEFGTASVLDILSKWRFPGTETRIRTEYGEFPAAELEAGVRFLLSSQHDHPIVEIETERSDEFVYLTPLDEALDGFDLLARAREILFGTTRGDSVLNFDGVIFPKIGYDEQVDISWLEGMTTMDRFGNPVRVSQALQQTRFRMDHLGAHGESAAAIGFETLGVSPPPFKIDRPFLTVIRRNGMVIPPFVCRFGPDSWKDPGNIG